MPIINLSTVNQEFELKLAPSQVPMKYPVDPIALSCASYREWITSGTRWAGWDADQVTAQDLEQAQQIRRHYRDRIAMQVLSGRTVSKFRQELYTICNGGTMYQHQQGMIYRLPYFYAEDMAREQLLADYGAGQELEDMHLSTPHVRLAHTLIPVRRVFRGRRTPKNEYYEYWYQGQQDQQLYMMEIEYQHTFRHMLDALFENPSVRLGFARFVRGVRSTGQRYWGISQPEILL